VNGYYASPGPAAAAVPAGNTVVEDTGSKTLVVSSLYSLLHVTYLLTGCVTVSVLRRETNITKAQCTPCKFLVLEAAVASCMLDAR